MGTNGENMSQGFDDTENVAPSTMHGRDWPCLRQFIVFMENKVGRLHELMRHVERHDIKIVALSVLDTVDFAVARVLVDQTDRVREILELSDFKFFESDILGVELPDTQQPYQAILKYLVSAELNISYTYPIHYRGRGKSAIAIFVDDVDQGARILRDKGVNLITEGDLLLDDGF